MISTAVLNYVLYTNCCHRDSTLTLGVFYCFFSTLHYSLYLSSFAAVQNKLLLLYYITYAFVDFAVTRQGLLDHPTVLSTVLIFCRYHFFIFFFLLLGTWCPSSLSSRQKYIKCWHLIVAFILSNCVTIYLSVCGYLSAEFCHYKRPGVAYLQLTYGQTVGVCKYISQCIVWVSLICEGIITDIGIWDLTRRLPTCVVLLAAEYFLHSSHWLSETAGIQ